ncbi:dual specificity protein phosphatase 3-like isoform X2 [Physella acuta]|nr:dual specificity protein phosphatase 3-like isoform X2 [Physella acuta]
MKRLGVTHVLNSALGKDAYHVNTNHVMYKKKDIEFLGIEATDFINCNLSKYFNTASNFIQEGVSGGGKVFVHCVQGVSRSATLVIAYLMIKHHMTVQDALRLVRSKREICPNPGFLQQLCDLNEQLKKSGHFKERLVGDNPGEDKDRIVKTISDDGYVENGCTVSELEAILTDSTGGLMMLPKTEYNQINDYILIGESAFINTGSKENIKHHQITHVLDAAYNKGSVSNSDVYDKIEVKFLGIDALDTLTFDISPYFSIAAEFIDDAVKNKGKVFVHCVHGISRSATLVVGYFMIKKGMCLKDALQFVRQKREICPNSNFLQQLCILETKLKLVNIKKCV